MTSRQWIGQYQSCRVANPGVWRSTSSCARAGTAPGGAATSLKVAPKRSNAVPFATHQGQNRAPSGTSAP